MHFTVQLSSITTQIENKKGHILQIFNKESRFSQVPALLRVEALVQYSNQATQPTWNLLAG